MIHKINITETDRQSLHGQASAPAADLAGMDFSGVVVNKPWGYEYLMFQNSDISIWMLYIKKGYSTSMHCHPKKKTSLLVILGEAVCSTLDEKFPLKEKEGLILEKGVFHTTEAVSENGIFVMELETPVDKTDLFRLKDRYQREKRGYTARKNITNKTYNYHYQFIEDRDDQLKVFGKYKIRIREYAESESLRLDLTELAPEVGILLDGQVGRNGQCRAKGDLVTVDELRGWDIQSKVRILFLQERRKLVKLSDYVIRYLQSRGFDKVFLISGGNLMHLLESVRTQKMDYFTAHHEQASAMAADAFARVTDRTGFVMVTSGPGGTNAITGAAGAWIDSIPLLVISGQSYSTQTIGKTGLRQLGVQEVNIIDMVRSFTKYAVMITDPRSIRYHLEKALYLAASGRPGPVWLDIPVNMQLTLVEEDELSPFVPESSATVRPDLSAEAVRTLEWIRESKRPIILLGNGVRLAHAEKEFFELADRLSIPIVTSRNANDLIWEDHPLNAGRVGSFGQRSANLAIQNSDLLISLGSRISLAVTGWAHGDFAREAKKVVVDIDPAELAKPTVKPDLAVCADVKDFILALQTRVQPGDVPDVTWWLDRIRAWKAKYPVILPEYAQTQGSVNTYYFLDRLSDQLRPDDVIVTDMGMSFQCTMQALKLKRGQKLFTASGLAPMGYGLPGAIGACVGHGGKRVICIAGDGGLMMNLQELQTVVHYRLPIKLFIFNNNGYTSMRETQRTYFTGYTAAEPGSGVSMPDFVAVAQAFGLPAKKVEDQSNLDAEIQAVLESAGPFVCDLKIAEDQLVIPKQGAFNRPDGKTVPRPIGDMIPYEDRETFDRTMIVEPVPFDPYKGEA